MIVFSVDVITGEFNPSYHQSQVNANINLIY
jgi:hypothetical protein